MTARTPGGGPPTGRWEAMNAALYGPPRAGRPRITNVKYKGRDSVGKPYYEVSVSSRVGFSVNTITWVGGVVGRPTFVDRSAGPGVPGGPGQGGTPLQDAKDNWLARIADTAGLSTADRHRMMTIVRNWRASPWELNSRMNREFMNVRQGVTAVAIGGDGPPPPDFGIDWSGGGGGGRGGGGGGLGPQYVAPDRRVIEDMAKGMLTSLVGTIPDGLVDSLVSVYMRDHRKNFDTLDREIDPSMSMLEAVRNTEQYQTIHALRPDSEDERMWIQQRQAAAQRGGLQTDLQEDFAIRQATIGGDLDDVETAAGFEQLHETGSVRGTSVEDTLREKATMMFRGMVV